MGVVELWRYPVKSMAGERLVSSAVSWHGLAGDRRWAFVRDGVERSGFPWLTIRERPEMSRFRPAFDDPDRPDRSRTLVATPDGESLDVVDPRLAERLGGGVRVLKQDRGVFDVMPLSVISVQTIEALSAMVGTPLDVRRFRPNLLVDVPGDDPFPEDGWVGRVLRVGTARLRIDQRDDRCSIVNFDPESLRREPEVLRTIAQRRATYLGVYGTVVEPGQVEVGDPVHLEPEALSRPAAR